MPYPIRPQLLMNNTACLLPLKFNLKFIKDTDMRKKIKDHYLLCQIVYPDIDTQSFMMQTKANEIAELYNHLYDLIGFAESQENPLENYDRFEEWTDNSNTNSSGNASSEYNESVMDSEDYKNVNKTDSESNGNVDEKNHHKGRIHGNIGVMTLGTAEQQTEDMYRRLYSLELQYIKEFQNFFLISL